MLEREHKDIGEGGDESCDGRDGRNASEVLGAGEVAPSDGKNETARKVDVGRLRRSG